MHYKYDAVTRKMMTKATDADTQLQMLKENITEGRLQKLAAQVRTGIWRIGCGGWAGGDR